MKNNAIKEFSRFAYTYDHYNVIQKEVAKKLVSFLPSSIQTTIIDIGCGSGSVYRRLQDTHKDFTHFVAIDSSSEMLTLHPSGENIRHVCVDFNTKTLINSLEKYKHSILLSSSALQWSKDLDFTLKILSDASAEAYFAIFTSNTFKTLHETAEIHSPIYDEKTIIKSVKKYYNAVFETQIYRLDFPSTEMMFKYIKKSGVSGGEKVLSFRQIKTLMKKYPLTYLEFEVLFVRATSLNID